MKLRLPPLCDLDSSGRGRDFSRRLLIAATAALLLVGCGAAQGSPNGAAKVVVTPSPSPSPSPTSPSVVVTNSTATPIRVVLDKRRYKVSWTAQGFDLFNVYVKGVDFAGTIIETKVVPPNPSSGETTFDASGGEYFLVVAPNALTWTITFTPA